MKKGISKVLRRAFSVILFLIGLVLILFSMLNLDTYFALLSEKIGLAFLVAGTVDLFRSLFQWRQEKSEIEAAIDDSISKALSCRAGLCLITPKRRGFSGYYTWAVSRARQDLFFAGRSVLHRIQSDLVSRKLGECEEIIYRKVREGSKLKILFLDPEFKLLKKLAEDEHQSEEQMIEDIANSLGITLRIKDYIEHEKCTILGSLQIRVYSDIPYFAYHREDDNVIVGFYFHTNLGCDTCGFEINDKNTVNYFEEHFVNIFSKSTPILTVNESKVTFNKEKYLNCKKYIATKIPALTLEKMMPNCQ